MNQSSIFDLPIAPPESPSNQFVFPIAVSLIAPQISPVEPQSFFKIADRVRSSKYFKKYDGKIARFDVFGGVEYAIVDYLFYGSMIEYPCPLSLLVPSAQPQENGVEIELFGNSEEFTPVCVGDRVLVLEHQFMRDRKGIVTKIDCGLASVDFGKGENIWAIAPERLQKI